MLCFGGYELCNHSQSTINADRMKSQCVILDSRGFNRGKVRWKHFLRYLLFHGEIDSAYLHSKVTEMTIK